MSDTAEKIDAIEVKISQQLDRLHYLMEQKRNPHFIKIEYKRFVTLVTEKYVLLQNALQDQKPHMAPETYTKQKQQLESQYKEDIISVALAIDEETKQA